VGGRWLAVKERISVDLIERRRKLSNDLGKWSILSIELEIAGD